MTQPTAAQGKFVDKNNNPQIQDRQDAIASLTYVGTPAGDISYNFFTNEENALSSLCDKLADATQVMRYHGLIAGGTQVTAAIAKVIDKGNNPQLGDRQAAITFLTDNSGGNATDALDYNPGQSWAEDCASLASNINKVLDALEYHGLINGSGTQVSASEALIVDKDNVPQLGDQQSIIPDITDNVGGTISDTIAASTNSFYGDDVASLAAKINAILSVQRLHGLIADS